MKVARIHTRLTNYEKERRPGIDAQLPDTVAVDRQPDLPARRPRHANDRIGPLPGEAASRWLFGLPPGVTSPPSLDAVEWTELRDEVATALGNRQLYNRDLPVIFEALRQVVERPERRRAKWGRL
ncbi:MAG: hypothetical protein QM628_00055 [Propionicimonas sp.]